jgi:queuine tRNA-ribosyltransferase accessory subunit
MPSIDETVFTGHSFSMERKELFETLRPVDPSIIGPRLGRLTVQGRNQLDTPNFLAITSRGVVPHMTPDVVAASTDIRGVHMALEDCKSTSRSRAHIPFPD